MKTKFGRLVILGAVIAASATFASADTINLGSFATGTTATSLGFSSSETAMAYVGVDFTTGVPTTLGILAPTSPTTTYALNPNGVWAPAIGNSSWVGYASSAGPGGSANPPYGYYEFTTTFTAVGGPGYGGMINVQADDTTEVLLNGTVVVPFGALGGDQHCADNAPTCSAEDTVNLGGLTLLSGTDANTLEFIVEQAGTVNSTPGYDPSGVDFTATFAATPEPSSLLLLGTGLLGAAGMLVRKRLTA
jgi:hypothetical protein